MFSENIAHLIRIIMLTSFGCHVLDVIASSVSADGSSLPSIRAGLRKVSGPGKAIVSISVSLGPTHHRTIIKFNRNNMCFVLLVKKVLISLLLAANNVSAFTVRRVRPGRRIWGLDLILQARGLICNEVFERHI